MIIDHFAVNVHFLSKGFVKFSINKEIFRMQAFTEMQTHLKNFKISKLGQIYDGQSSDI